MHHGINEFARLFAQIETWTWTHISKTWTYIRKTSLAYVSDLEPSEFLLGEGCLPVSSPSLCPVYKRLHFKIKDSCSKCIIYGSLSYRSSDGKESACNVGDPGSIPGLGRSPGGGNGSPLQLSCLENPMDRGAWRATVCGVTRVGYGWVAHATRTLTWPSRYNLHLQALLSLSLLKKKKIFAPYSHWKLWCLASYSEIIASVKGDHAAHW